MPTRTYACRKVVGGVGAGPALVADTRISFWGGFDPVAVTIVEVGSPLRGEAVAGKVLVFRSTKGSSGTSRMLRLAKIEGHVPAAFINTELDELSVLACVAQRLPLVTDLACDPFGTIRTGDVVRVDADRGVVEVTSPDGPERATAGPVRRATSGRIALTDEQRRMADGVHGPVRAEHLRRLIEWGEAFGTERLILVENVMPNGLSVPNRTLGDVPFELIEGYSDYVKSCLAESVAVTATSQATCFDLVRPDRFEADARQAPAQQEMLDLARRSDICLTWTCAPYLIGNVPVKGQVCAWTESHAVIYLNSFLGARSTRNGNESSTAAAVTGWFPEFGVLRTENRHARFVVEVLTPLATDTDWGCLGYFAGKVGGLRIPAFVGLRSPRLEAARRLCAALATSGDAPMLHLVGVTPEAPTLEDALGGGAPPRRK